MPPRKQTPPPPPPPTYPARPMNGGRLEKAEPLPLGAGIWRYRPKYNGRRVLLHVPTMRTWNRQLEENNWIFPCFKKLREIIYGPTVVGGFEWLDIELLYGKTSIAKRSLVVLDYVSDEPWIDRMTNLDKAFGEQSLLTTGQPKDDEVYFARPLSQFQEHDTWLAMQDENKTWGVTFYEGLVSYNISEPYPIQLFSPKKETRHWIKYRFID